jgi:tRNA(Ile)-lysidine synthase
VLSPEYILNTLKTECGYRDGDSILVGVSGGADSVALLHLIHAAGIPCAAAHVNYGLRGEESNGDEQFVSELCAKLCVPLYTRRTNREEQNNLSNNLQDAARAFRSKFFAEIRQKESMPWTAVAHNAGDQLETMLINVMRGSGLRGISGMRFTNGKLIRPLLKTTRTEIESYLNAASQKWRDDSSNAGDDYLRNRIRHHVVPAIQSVDEREGKGIIHTWQQLQEQQRLLDQLIEPLREEAMEEHYGYRTIRKSVLERFPQPHLLLNQFLYLSGNEFQFTEETYRAFVNGQAGKRIEERSLQLYNDRDQIAEVYDINPGDYPITIYSGSNHHEWWCETIAVNDPTKYSGQDAVVDPNATGPELLVRQWKAGDKMQPYGFNGTKKVSDILTEMKIPPYLKENYPIVTVNDEIVWIPGYRIAEKYKVTPETKTALHIKWHR